ncbi:MAG: DNA-binding protein Alba [Methanocaldococcus sp.]
MDNVVLVGKKPVMNYVVAVLTQLTSNDEVIIKARGKAINKAVDVAEMIRNRFIKDIKVKKIEIGTDKVKNPDGREVNVSTIEIVLAK